MQKNIPIVFLIILINLNTYSQDFVWSKTFGGESTEYIHEMITDDENNIFVVGGFYDSVNIENQWHPTQNYLDAYVMKLNPEGALLWFKNFGGPAWDMAIDIKFDNDFEYFYLTGFFEEVIDFESVQLNSKGVIDMYIAKFDMDGNVIWAKNGGGNWHDYGYCLAVDDDDNVYLTGMYESMSFEFDGSLINNIGGTDIYILKLNPDGELQWLKNAGGSSYDEPTDMIIEPNNLMITGKFSQNASFDELHLYGYNNDLFLVRYNLDGEPIWASSAHSEGSVKPSAITQGNDGNYYLCGLITDNTLFDELEIQLTGQENTFIAKANLIGEFEWVQNFGGTDFNTAYDISGASSDNILLAGAMAGTVHFPGNDLSSNGFSDAYFASFKQDGTMDWVFQLGNDDSQYGDDGRVIFEDNSGQLLIAGRFTKDITLGNNTYQAYGGRDIYMSYLDEATFVNQKTEALTPVVYPNPVSNEIIHVSLPQGKIIRKVQIINIQGAICWQSFPFRNQIQIKTERLRKGIYLIRMITDREDVTKRIIKL